MHLPASWTLGFLASPPCECWLYTKMATESRDMVAVVHMPLGRMC